MAHDNLFQSEENVMFFLSLHIVCSTLTQSDNYFYVSNLLDEGCLEKRQSIIFGYVSEVVCRLDVRCITKTIVTFTSRGRCPLMHHGPE